MSDSASAGPHCSQAPAGRPGRSRIASSTEKHRLQRRVLVDLVERPRRNRVFRHRNRGGGGRRLRRRRRRRFGRRHHRCRDRRWRRNRPGNWRLFLAAGDGTNDESRTTAARRLSHLFIRACLLESSRPVWEEVVAHFRDLPDVLAITANGVDLCLARSRRRERDVLAVRRICGTLVAAFADW